MGKNTLKQRAMRLLKYLFFKYYQFQVKVGNEDIAPFSAILILSVILGIIYADILLFCFRFIPFFNNKSFISWYSFLLLYVITFIVLYFFIIHKKKYKTILITYSSNMEKGKNSLGVILFTFIPIILFYIELLI